MHSKKLTLVLVFILGIIVLGTALYLSKIRLTNEVSNNQPHQQAKTYSMSGTVEKITGRTYTLQDSQNKKSFRLTPDTTIFKRTKTKSGITLVATTINNIKIGSSLVVYSSKDDPNLSQIAVDTIEIVK